MIYYLITMTIIVCFIMEIDKYKAAHHRYRISEKLIFLIALIGGSLGVWMGMYLFHHKTRHWYFVWGIPFILLIQIFIGYQFHNAFDFFL